MPAVKDRTAPSAGRGAAVAADEDQGSRGGAGPVGGATRSEARAEDRRLAEGGETGRRCSGLCPEGATRGVGAGGVYPGVEIVAA